MAQASTAFPAGVGHTEAAGRILQVAQQIARNMQWAEVRTEHLLVAAVAEQEGHAARALKALGVSPATITAAVEELLGPGRGAPAGSLPYTPRSQRVLSETALAAAKALGHEQIGSAHILLALINEDHAALQVLYRLGVSRDSVREEIALLLGVAAIPPIPVTPGGSTVEGSAVPQRVPAPPQQAAPAAATSSATLLPEGETGVAISPQVLAVLLKAHQAAQARHDTLVLPEHLLLGLLSLGQPNKLVSLMAEHGLTLEQLAAKLFD